MPGLIRFALRYLIAVLLPIVIGEIWPGPEGAKPVAGYVFFLCTALLARFAGFGPALVCTISAAITLWHIVLATAEHSAGVQLLRLFLFVTASVVVATVSRQKSRAVHAAEERVRALFDASIDAMLFFDSDGRYVDANPAATTLLGVGRNEITRQCIGDFSPPEDRPKVDALLDRLIAQGTMTGEWPVVRKDGTVRETEYRAVANILPNLHCIISNDVTDRRVAERSLDQLSRRLLQLGDEERRRIARQLHDTTAQSLAAIRLHLTRISRSPAADDPAVREALEEIVALTDQSIAEIRTLSYLLHPPMIDEAGLLPSLRWFVRGFEERSGIATTLEVPEEMERLPREVETAVFRIVQEALTNLQRHSGSAVAKIRVERSAQQLRLRIEDEGRGLAPELREDRNALRSAGIGVAGIEQRTRELGGTLDIRSNAGGTAIDVTLPLAEP